MEFFYNKMVQVVVPSVGAKNIGILKESDVPGFVKLTSLPPESKFKNKWHTEVSADAYFRPEDVRCILNLETYEEPIKNQNSVEKAPPFSGPPDQSL